MRIKRIRLFIKCFENSLFDYVCYFFPFLISTRHFVYSEREELFLILIIYFVVLFHSSKNILQSES